MPASDRGPLAAPLVPADLDMADIHRGDSVGFNMIVSADDVTRFAAVTGDQSPLHMSDEYARQAGYAGRVAHGLLVASSISTLVGMFLPGRRALLLAQRMDFLEPVIAGSTIAVSGRVIHVSLGTRTITLTTLVSHGGVLVGRGAATARVRRQTDDR
jgi:3-hydroxybutyryl-CoA dehydratase